MGILNEIFMRCKEFNNEQHLLFEREAVKQYDREINQKIRNFMKEISDVQLQEQLTRFFEEIDELNNARDSEVSKLFIVHGMSVYMQLQHEILTT
ncbi:hypothetical protein Ami103574_04200 [Aminipila butyrica]|uniref:Uncharacterized protein n=1 Tax=Aminipila butyrica TaxID=433296 RepID=A0A858BT91_9FIRM|nr:hypothetical protein [Aminipila butyrica]QIB68572.1 hypothetical protein Ami103574_04200 [Aminipila butyrica]